MVHGPRLLAFCRNLLPSTAFCCISACFLHIMRYVLLCLLRRRPKLGPDTGPFPFSSVSSSAFPFVRLHMFRARRRRRSGHFACILSAFLWFPMCSVCFCSSVRPGSKRRPSPRRSPSAVVLCRPRSEARCCASARVPLVPRRPLLPDAHTLAHAIVLVGARSFVVCAPVRLIHTRFLQSHTSHVPSVNVPSPTQGTSLLT